MWRSSRDEAFVLRSLLTSEAALENVQPAVVSHKHSRPLMNSFLLWWQRHFSVKALITLAAFYYFSHSFTTSYKTKKMQSHHSKKQIRRRKHRILCFCSFLHDFFLKMWLFTKIFSMFRLFWVTIIQSKAFKMRNYSKCYCKRCKWCSPCGCFIPAELLCCLLFLDELFTLKWKQRCVKRYCMVFWNSESAFFH